MSVATSGWQNVKIDTLNHKGALKRLRRNDLTVKQVLVMTRGDVTIARIRFKYMHHREYELTDVAVRNPMDEPNPEYGKNLAIARVLRAAAKIF